jgi:ATP adenylyltransferase
MEKLWAPWRMEYILDSKESGDECIFCDLPRQKNDEQNYIIFRSKLSFVMLNKFPYNNGHIMVIPYKHEADYTALDQDILADIQQLIQKSLIALKNCMEPHGYNVGLNLGRTAGAGIDAHLHYHIVPRWSGDTNFMPVLSDTKVISESLEKSWQKLSREFEKL